MFNSHAYESWRCVPYDGSKAWLILSFRYSRPTCYRYAYNGRLSLCHQPGGCKVFSLGERQNHVRWGPPYNFTLCVSCKRIFSGVVTSRCQCVSSSRPKPQKGVRKGFSKPADLQPTHSIGRLTRSGTEYGRERVQDSEISEAPIGELSTSL